MLVDALSQNLGGRRDFARAFHLRRRGAIAGAARSPGADLGGPVRPPRWAESGSPAYLLGTDNLGRDMLSRIIYGSRISLMVGAATVIFAGFVGCALGAIAGYFGRTPDEIVSKISEIFLAFPFLLIAIAIMAFLGQGRR